MVTNRDTIIEVVETKTGYKARIRVYSSTLETAQSGDFSPATGFPTKAVKRARDVICQQARAAMARGKPPRTSNGFLSWRDISITVVADHDKMAETQVVTRAPVQKKRRRKTSIDKPPEPTLF